MASPEVELGEGGRGLAGGGLSDGVDDDYADRKEDKLGCVRQRDAQDLRRQCRHYEGGADDSRIRRGRRGELRRGDRGAVLVHGRERQRHVLARAQVGDADDRKNGEARGVDVGARGDSLRSDSGVVAEWEGGIEGAYEGQRGARW